MKIKVFDAVNLYRWLNTIDLSRIPETANVVTDICAAIFPHTIEYDTALAAFQKEAIGKKPDEAENLVSAKTWEKIANKEVDLIYGLTRKDADIIRRNLFTVKGSEKMPHTAADCLSIYKFVNRKGGL